MRNNIKTIFSILFIVVILFFITLIISSKKDSFLTNDNQKQEKEKGIIFKTFSNTKEQPLFIMKSTIKSTSFTPKMYCIKVSS